MSEIITVKEFVFTDADLIKKVCEELKYTYSVKGSHRFFGEKENRSGQKIEFEAAHRVMIVDAKGAYHYDVDHQKYVDAFKQAYNVSKIEKEARLNGKSLKKVTMRDGTIKLTLSQ